MNLLKSHLKYASLLKFSYSEYCPFWGVTGTWWPESLAEGKTVSGDSHWSLQGTAGEALAMEWSGATGRVAPLLIFSLFPFVDFFFCAGWHSSPSHHPLLEILSNPLMKPALGWDRTFLPHHKHQGARNSASTSLKKNKQTCKHSEVYAPKLPWTVLTIVIAVL